jgi:hypothetical protein
MKILQALKSLKDLRAILHQLVIIEGCDMEGIDRDIQFLRELFDNHLNDSSAEEQNKLVNLIQKLVLIRDMRR